MKVAQYEVLGIDAKRDIRPGGTIETFGSSRPVLAGRQPAGIRCHTFQGSSRDLEAHS